ncbi:MAG: class I SAM-dependent methyltransferase [Nanoarchaeota archaeon]|nr:class I SAM-dependent methyltransferase [Nanoarchaeota archaeon]
MKTVREYYDQQWKGSAGDIFSQAFQTAISYSYELLGEIQSKKVLEIGGGSGEQACFFSARGAEVTVIDISLESLKMTEERAQKRKAFLQIEQMDAENMSFADNHFDLIYCNSVLMHVNLQKVMGECSRVLKKGGKLITIEPLRYAPFVQLYRFFSPYKKMKPRYATLRMFRESKRYFSHFSHQEFYLFSSALLPILYGKSTVLQELYHFVAKRERFLFKLCPWLRSCCWVSVVQYQK